jgi:hypothetical protein
VYDLDDIDCLRIETRVASMEDHVFDGKGWKITDPHKEEGSANANELHSAWANKAAELDIWELRRIDRARYGGIVLTAETAEVIELARDDAAVDHRVYWIWSGDPLASPGFHLKTFDFELDELHEDFQATSIDPYDMALRS